VTDRHNHLMSTHRPPRAPDETAKAWPGHWSPPGSTWDGEATNLTLWAPDAERVQLCMFDHDGVETRLDMPERTFDTWHGRFPDLTPGTRYGFRVYGPWDPARGMRFNPAKLLLDPYARAVTGELKYGPAVFGHRRPNLAELGEDVLRSGLDSAGHVPVSVLVHDEFDWTAENRPRIPWADTVVYELHVRGFTMRHPAVPEELRGTYAGLAHPAVIEHLVDLGVTSVELMPVHHFVTEPHLALRGMHNYWGYNSIAFFAPHAAYSSSGTRGEQVHEFKMMVKALHQAGLEVILDVVYNHTAEGGVHGPTLCFRGIANSGYYRLREGGRDYADYTGTGNTLDMRQLDALMLVTDSLRYWVTEMHVDGFRFDLASALARSMHDVDLLGSFMTVIQQDPILREVKLVAEPWDVGQGGYQVGAFPHLWTEWNDQYRDTLRDFWRGQLSGVRDLAYRLSGSSDLYADDGRHPYASVNFITAHDGFTLRDLVSYDRKHNEDNGEDNRDGSDYNRSWNCGVEGATDDPAINTLRRLQIRNFLTSLLLSTGVPMLLAGDEMGRTQLGNNNAYCQDNEVSWVDWSLLNSWSDIHDLVRALLRLRRAEPVFRQRHFFAGQAAYEGGRKDVAWFGVDGLELTGDQWFDPAQRTLGMFLSGDAIRGRGPHGEPIVGSSFLWWLHADPNSVEVVLPERPWARSYVELLIPQPETPITAGKLLTLPGRSVTLLRAD
jgi:isoamylase